MLLIEMAKGSYYAEVPCSDRIIWIGVVNKAKHPVFVESLQIQDKSIPIHKIVNNEELPFNKLDTFELKQGFWSEKLKITLTYIYNDEKISDIYHTKETYIDHCQGKITLIDTNNIITSRSNLSKYSIPPNKSERTKIK